MASAKKCDRCGKYYDKNINDYEGEKRGGNDFPYEHVHITDKCSHGRRYDFCDNCIEAFFIFMNAFKNISEVSSVNCDDICETCTEEQIKECKLWEDDGK